MQPPDDQEESNASPPPESEAQEPRRRLRWMLVGLGVLALLLGGLLTALFLYGDSQIGHVPVETAVPGDLDGDDVVDDPQLARRTNVLIVGSDSREELSAEERRELGTGSSPGTRTDTLMLLQLDPARDRPVLLSLPRDLLVDRCDGTSGRINEAYAIGEDSNIGGPTCTVRTVRELTGLPIHHYVQIGFEGLVGVVDVLDGVPICLTKPLQDDSANIDLPSGCQTLNGREALGFVRARKVDDDFGRIARQQRFITAVVERVSRPNIGLNIPKLVHLARAVGDAVQTDERLSLNVMRRIATTFRGAGDNGIDARTVPGTNQVIDGVAYVVAEQRAAGELFAALRQGEPLPDGVGVD